MKLNIPALDVSAANEGKFFHYLNGVSCKIARYGNPTHAEALRKVLKAHEGDDDAKNIASEIASLTAETILLDWMGMTDGSDANTEIPYSKDIAIELLTSDEYIHFQGWVERTSKRMANFYVEEANKTVK